MVKSSPVASRAALREYAIRKAGKWRGPVIVSSVVIAVVEALLQRPAGGFLRAVAAGLIVGVVGWLVLFVIYRYLAPEAVMGKDFDSLSGSYEKVMQERDEVRKELEEARYKLGLPEWGHTNPETKKRYEVSHVAQRIVRERDDALRELAAIKQAKESELDVHVAPFHGSLMLELKEHIPDDILSKGYVVYFTLSITNRSDVDMTLDYSVTLRLLEPALHPRDATTVDLSVLQLTGRQVEFSFDVLTVPHKQNRTFHLAFLLAWLDASASRGIGNIADEGHRFFLSDRVSDLKRDIEFELWRPRDVEEVLELARKKREAAP